MPNRKPSYRRGEIWWVNLDPARGNEAQKTRPCLVLQNDVGNQMGNTTIVAPIMRNHKTYPFVVNIDPSPQNGIDAERHINLSQMRVVDRSRFTTRLGTIEAKYWDDIEEAVCAELGFSEVFR